jgi:predicted metalloprotease with PDZ domain
LIISSNAPVSQPSFFARWEEAALTLLRLLVGLIAAAPVLAAGPPLHYLLDLREPASHRIRVTMTVPEARAGTELQFPAWYALYQIRDFVRNVEELEARCGGEPFRLTRVDLYTWRSGPQDCAPLELRYAVHANEDSVYAAVLNERHSFMNFALLLFYLPRERERSARVKFLLPATWRLATLLEESPSPGEYQVENYDVLADSPAEAGVFQDYSYVQNGATYRVVVDAEPGDYSSRRLLTSLEKITAATTALLADAPFSRYTFIFHFPREGAAGGMEHRNGTAISLSAKDLRANWSRLETVAAHEFFHAWNVKRIRPRNLEPIDYVRGNDTRDLWFAEGLTSTYQEFILLRAGLISRGAFYDRLAAEIKLLQDRPARHWQSAEEAGQEAWLEKYPDYLRPERSISYYNKGALLGFLLDLAIRHASANRHSLDDLMRRLNEDFARRGRYFTSEDLKSVAASLVPNAEELSAFFPNYVQGTTELDYDKYLGYAGLRLITRAGEPIPLGLHASTNLEGLVEVVSVERGSAAARAGLQPGDFLLEMDGRRLTSSPEDQMGALKPGKKVRFRIRRGRREFSLEVPLAPAEGSSYRVEESGRATPPQLRVRRGFLERTTEAAAGAG